MSAANKKNIIPAASRVDILRGIVWHEILSPPRGIRYLARRGIVYLNAREVQNVWNGQKVWRNLEKQEKI